MEGWKKTPLGEVCTLQRGFDLPKRLRIQGDFPLMSSSGRIDTHTEGRVKGPGVVTGRSGSIGSVFFVEEDFWPLNTTLYVKDFHGNDPRFIYHLLNSFDLSRFASGAGVPTLNRNNVHSELVYIPISLPEQERIVAILDEAFAAIATATANAEKNLANARELFESELDGVFSHTDDGWVEMPLGNAVDETCSLSYGIVQPGKDYPNGLPVVRPTDMGGKVIYPEGLKRIDPNLASAYTRTSLEGGEILLCVRGSTGTISIASEELAGANVTRGIVPIRFNFTNVAQEFGYYLLLSDHTQKQIREKTYGTALMQINIRDLRKLLIQFPNLMRQEAIAEKLDVLSEETKSIESIYQQKLALLAELKQSILHKAFSGELTADAKAADRTLSEAGL